MTSKSPPTPPCEIWPTEKDIEDFIEKRFAGKVPQGKKKALIMVGGPGSGKSSTKSEALKHLGFDEDSFVDVDPDASFIPLFKKDNGCRFKMREINGKVFSRAWKGDYNIIYDGTGSNFENYSKNPVRYLQKKDYYVVLCITLLDKSKANDRVKTRLGESGRHISQEFLDDTYSNLEKGIPKYLDIKCVDQTLNKRIPQLDAILVYNNNVDKSSKPQLLYEMQCDEPLKANVSSSGLIGPNPEIIKSTDGGRRRKRRTKSVKRRKTVRMRKSFKKRKSLRRLKKVD
jgi:predicted ABC-type ATPase